MIKTIILFIIVGYIIGCLHGSKVAQFLSGVDLKKTGHGNAGASNATLSLGWKYGVLVALIDIGKGVLAIIGAHFFLADAAQYTEVQVWLFTYLIAAGVILGHNFPFHMGFNGGKGTASIIGILLAVDWKIGLFALILFVILSFATNYLIVGVLEFYLVFCTATFLWIPGMGPTIIALLLFGIAVILHIENIKRLVKGTEPKVTSAFKKK
ncbi:glycerol-3-phosphate acyltransferase [Lysinibacillus pakistanensis]|uniref:Glycerol-3-phosphate acyltransferase n=1 Tax=Lysinibacillus pakistanensis TaxID=759811 RepID=A0AAX3WW91_9BACI|nr:glycerol-3-phosphate acyltransferase [Lysinibacillus pakistanensis]MDM5231540.1 glycerol-3-phosphate acyltransferase [Lysinibacillus pakistanensis]WHY47087.1 glycerol-3-phosphate acyltransferase [Lysinibacillus pakistanensis]WHY52097.1 glycerol-3-phosphate acyltransferase [Lysinibacillus pakistanensis]